MACAPQIVKLDWRNVILLLLCLSIFFGPHINWKCQVAVRTRNAVSVVSRRTTQVAKDRQLTNLTQKGIYGSNDMDTRVDTCCVVVNSKFVSFPMMLARYNHSCTHISL